MATTVQTSVQAFFDDYAEALSSYSPERIATFYHTPLAIYSDLGTRMVAKQEETLAFWKSGIKQYESQGIKTAEPTILSEEQLSSAIYVSKVLWRNFDQDEKEVGAEVNFYVLILDKGELKICGLIVMAEKSSGKS